MARTFRTHQSLRFAKTSFRHFPFLPLSRYTSKPSTWASGTTGSGPGVGRDTVTATYKFKIILEAHQPTPRARNLQSMRPRLRLSSQ
jgi:hypothetical protein